MGRNLPPTLGHRKREHQDHLTGKSKSARLAASRRPRLSQQPALRRYASGGGGGALLTSSRRLPFLRLTPSFPKRPRFRAPAPPVRAGASGGGGRGAACASPPRLEVLPLPEAQAWKERRKRSGAISPPQEMPPGGARPLESARRKPLSTRKRWPSRLHLLSPSRRQKAGGSLQLRASTSERTRRSPASSQPGLSRKARLKPPPPPTQTVTLGVPTGYAACAGAPPTKHAPQSHAK